MHLSENDVLDILRQTGALLEGHFVLTSGLHSPHYVEKFRVLEHPLYTARLCEEIARNNKEAGITVVVGPMTGGIILAHEVGKQLGVRAMFTERVDGKMAFRRGFTLTPDDVVLLVEDIVTTGGSIMEVIDAVKPTGARIAGLAYLVDRSGGKADFGIPAKPLVTMDIQTWKPDACPLCAAGAPITKPGSTGKK